MADNVVTIADLHKSYDDRAALDGLSFEVKAGRVTAFLGPNGAGKTTTIRAALGLVRPDQGEALVFGQRFRDLSHPLRRVGVLVDGSGFHPLRSGRQHLRALAAAAGVSTLRVDAVLDSVGLEEAANRRVGAFSLGMRQRLGLASALLGEPELLILDEPANGLDPAGIRWLREFLTEWTVHGRSVLVSSHVLSEVSQFADDVVVVDRGRLVVQTAMASLTSDATVTVSSPEIQRLAEALAARGAVVTPRLNSHLDVSRMSIEEVGQTAADANIVLHRLSQRVVSLEETFLQLTGAEREHHARPHQE